MKRSRVGPGLLYRRKISCGHDTGLWADRWPFGSIYLVRLTRPGRRFTALVSQSWRDWREASHRTAMARSDQPCSAGGESVVSSDGEASGGLASPFAAFHRMMARELGSSGAEANGLGRIETSRQRRAESPKLGVRRRRSSDAVQVRVPLSRRSGGLRQSELSASLSRDGDRNLLDSWDPIGYRFRRQFSFKE